MAHAWTCDARDLVGGEWTPCGFTSQNPDDFVNFEMLRKPRARGQAQTSVIDGHFCQRHKDIILQAIGCTDDLAKRRPLSGWLEPQYELPPVDLSQQRDESLEAL